MSPTATASDRYKWVALSNTTLGVLMAALDGSIVIIALPAIFRGIGLDPLAPGNIGYLLWMILGYLLTSAVLVATFGRLGDIFGRVPMYNLGFLVFSVASLALSVDPFTGADGALWLIGFRVVQAVGGAMLTANSAAILTDAFPIEQRGMALGVNQITALAGQFIGLLAGGLLAVINWRAVFWINVPIGIVGTLWSYRSLREIGSRRPARIDWLGNLTFTAGTGVLLASITVGIQPYGGYPTGGTSPWVLGGLAAGIGLLVVFCIVETRMPASQRGVASGMRSTFQNAGTSLSIGVFFSLMIAGLATSLPATLAAGLQAQRVPATVAAGVAQLPPVSNLFAAFLGSNPIGHLLAPTGVLVQLPAGNVATPTVMPGRARYQERSYPGIRGTWLTR